MSKYARRMAVMAESADVVKGLFSTLNDPELISLGIGAPAKEALPVDILREISNDIPYYPNRLRNVHRKFAFLPVGFMLQ